MCKSFARNVQTFLCLCHIYDRLSIAKLEHFDAKPGYKRMFVEGFGQKNALPPLNSLNPFFTPLPFFFILSFFVFSGAHSPRETIYMFMLPPRYFLATLLLLSHDYHATFSHLTPPLRGGGLRPEGYKHPHG